MERPARIDAPLNRKFTYQYAQPDVYHFCQDSVIVPMLVAEWLRSRPVADEFRALDLCAGCGVMGFELAHYEPRLRAIDFLEVQGAFFSPSFERNVAVTGFAGARWIEANFTRLLEPSYAQTYDLIIANPPYFFEGDGLLSPCEERNRCRFFLDSDFSTLIRGIAAALKPEGNAFVLVKSGHRHGRLPSLTISSLLAGVAEAKVFADVRGTDLIQITKQRSPYSCQR